MPPLSNGGMFNAQAAMGIVTGRYNMNQSINNIQHIGNSIPNYGDDSISIGRNVHVNSANCIAIGANIKTEKPNEIQIGSRDMTDNDIYLSNVNIREMQSRIEQLEEIVEKQNKLIEAMWYAPGMPGYDEGKQMWANDTGEND
jgi:hypothetical protein